MARTLRIERRGGVYHLINRGNYLQDTESGSTRNGGQSNLFCFSKTLTPLRRLLDALPRLIAASANPQNPMVAELAIRNGLDERVFAEIQKILLEQD